MSLLTSKEVCNWPEYIAFAERLGIPGKGIVAVNIDMRVNEVVKVKTEFLVFEKESSEGEIAPANADPSQAG